MRVYGIHMAGMWPKPTSINSDRVVRFAFHHIQMIFVVVVAVFAYSVAYLSKSFRAENVFRIYISFSRTLHWARGCI